MITIKLTHDEQYSIHDALNRAAKSCRAAAEGIEGPDRRAFVESAITFERLAEKVEDARDDDESTP